jgi:hypothetical protein
MQHYLIFLFFLIGCGKPISDGGRENKFSFSSTIEESLLFNTTVYHNFYLLPSSGFVRGNQTFWTGDSWNLKNGSINKRWNSSDDGEMDSPGYRTLLSMTEKSIRNLSPSEKFDIFLGRYHYPLKQEVHLQTQGESMNWEGLCHGWAAATINHPEPKPKVAENPDGIMVPFGSSDLKALLTWAYSKSLLEDRDILGKRCEGELETIEDYCENDLSAMNFHLALTNLVGLRGRSIIADIERSEEVWNHPILSYNSVIIRHLSQRQLKLKTTVTYLEVSQNNNWERQPRITGKITFEYDLTLSETGNIIGGQWLSRERPDFLWRMRPIENLDHILPGLGKLLN